MQRQPDVLGRAMAATVGGLAGLAAVRAAESGADVGGGRRGALPEVRNELETSDRFVFSKNRNVRKDGSVINCEWYNSTVLGEDGKAAAVLSLVLAVTERERYEETLRRTDRQKDAFLATLAHELRNPLAPLHNAAELLKWGRSHQHLEQVEGILARQVWHMTRLLGVAPTSKGRASAFLYIARCCRFNHDV
jgi:signal transduction histidine kinase